MTQQHAPQQSGKHEEELVLFPESPAAGAESWLGGNVEGQLAVDVQETDRELIVKSAIAGVQPDDLDVFVHNDMLTIRGKRHDDEVIQQGKSLVRECHWGGFSRSLILPVEVDTDNISATLKNGILTIRMTKIGRSKKIVVKET